MITNVKIRRNMSIKTEFTMSVESQESARQLIESLPKLTPEQQELVDKWEAERDELERKIWEYLKENPTKDLDGELITPETHEVGFDTEMQEIDGCLWSVVSQVYIQPKKSEFEKIKEQTIKLYE